MISYALKDFCGPDVGVRLALVGPVVLEDAYLT